MKKTIIRIVIWAIIGVIVAVIMGRETGYDREDMMLFLIFWPIYFIGIGFAGWKIIGKIYLGIFTVQFLNWRDKYHILTTLAGALVFSYIVIFGWLVGLIRLVFILVRYFIQKHKENSELYPTGS